GARQVDDGLYVYLPPALITPGAPQTYHVADDGSTYVAAGLAPGALARESEGQVYPARPLTRSTVPAGDFTVLHRREGGLRLPDPSRFGGLGVRIEARPFTGGFPALGAVATVNQPAETQFPGPNPWPAFQYRASVAALSGTVPEDGLLSLLVKPLTGNFLPATELIVRNRRGQGLL